MADFGFSISCRFPHTGVNCTERYIDMISPAIQYSTTAGIVTYAILLIPTLYITHIQWTKYKTGGAKRRSGPGIRLLCALSNCFAGFFCFILFATGHCIIYPADELVGGLSFFAVTAATTLYLTATTTALLMVRRVFLATVLRKDATTSRRHKAVLVKKLHNVKETHLAIILLLPPSLLYAITTMLNIFGVVQDNILLWRMNIGGLLVYAADMWIVGRVYGLPVVEALKRFADGGSSVADQHGTWRPVDIVGVNTQVNALAGKLEAHLKFQKIFFPSLAVMFAFISVSNALSFPEVSAMFFVQCGLS
jgi:hypothetical protein